MKKPQLDVICIGRSSVDLYGGQIGGRLEDMSSFSKYVGGSPTNISIGCARLGLKSALITRVGNEHMGKFIREQLERESVDTSFVITDPERLSALVILGIRDQNKFPLIFYRENCADMALNIADIDLDFIKSSKAVVVTGTHFSTEEVSNASFKAIHIARKFGKKIVFDIDYRPNLWALSGHGDGENRFIESQDVTKHIQRILPFCDLIIGTEEEWHLAGGSTQSIKALSNCREITKAIIVCKRGELGCTIFEDQINSWSQGVNVPVKKIDIFNVLGAGDGFMAGFLYGWLNNKSLENCAIYANACGALAVSRHGCAPSYPSIEELEHFVENGSKEFSLRKDKQLEQIHWSTNRRKRNDKLLTFAFDHRQQFIDLAKRTNKSFKDIEKFKRIALNCAKKLQKQFRGLGVIIDDQFGSSYLNEASDYDLWIGRPIEISGEFPLKLNSENDLGSFLNEWPANHCVKVLAPVRTDDKREILEYHDNMLLYLFHACRNTNHELLLEIINSRNDKPSSSEQILNLIERYYNLGIFPDWWKLEPIEDEQFWKECGNIIRKFDPNIQGILILGKDSSIKNLEKIFKVSRVEPLVKGFAVGRAIFFNTAKSWFNDKISDREAENEMIRNYENTINAWNSFGD